MNRLRMKGRIVVMLLAGIFVFFVHFSYADPSPRADEVSIQKKMQEMIHFLDSKEYAAAVSWDEHVILAFELAQKRLPTTEEFFLIGELQKDIALKRSDALSIAMRGKKHYPTWKQCRAFLNRVHRSHFRADRKVREAARQLAAAPRSPIVERLMRQTDETLLDLPESHPTALAVSNVQYNIYFGYLHAHSNLSDGDGSPLEAYTYARDVGNLDFFALTDHGEQLRIWPWQRKWRKLVNAAQATYDVGRFVTLWGFEWSNPVYGHINVLNTGDYTDSVSLFQITRLYDWIRSRPGAIGRFNHPGQYDLFFVEFLHLQPSINGIPQMVGIETWNGSNSFDTFYYDGSWLNNFSYWDVGNRKGWFLGALGGQDNHGRDWGTQNHFRTAVLAENLTRADIVDAYLNRRFYSTEDADLHLDVRYQGYPMGSRIGGAGSTPRTFVVTAHDGSDDTFREVRLYCNGSLLETRAVSGTSIQVTVADSAPTGAAYYYVIVVQNDDNDGNGRNDEAITSPIWIE